jgi:hypothetical protein
MLSFAIVTITAGRSFGIAGQLPTSAAEHYF